MRVRVLPELKRGRGGGVGWAGKAAGIAGTLGLVGLFVACVTRIAFWDGGSSAACLARPDV